MKRTLLAMWVALLIAVPLGCSQSAGVTDSADRQRFAVELSRAVTTDSMMGHLAKLQEIADANGGTRAVGTPGYDASVNYVAETLRARGFDVQMPEFQTKVFEAEKPSLTVGGATVPSTALQFSAGTPADGVTGPLVAAPADETPGCAPVDYQGLPVAGAVVLVDRGSCPFRAKETIAAKLGAVALVVADNVDEEYIGGTLGEQGEVTIPVLGISKADGARLRAAAGPATVTLKATTETITARNVIAQTKTGSTQNVVMTGGHLDSVPEGPGINDNGSGVAAILETAVQLGSAAPVRNAVRFAFWGAEELGTVGSTKYLESLDVEQLKDIALYLNFDMIGSPNPGYFAYDGDQSADLGPDQSVPRVPEGSAGIERTFAAYLKAAGKTPQDAGFDGRSDYDGFTLAGIPSGGLFSGAEEKMSPEQAKLWGGKAEMPFDPNYHKPTDTLDHVDRDAQGINGRGVAYGVGFYAQSLDGRNGMPAREDRTRHMLPKS
ncbi:MAG: M20/M25/M40 family metallo-hydrolase [Mycobacterium sp.]|nr:M20/M25/M40 family metallo-hydrolase [Mycobacterium sp.]